MEELAIINATVPVYKNPDLTKATRRIYGAVNEIKSRYFEISATIAAVAASKSYVDDGFEDVHGWTESAFGLKKTTSYDMLRIGKEYIRQQLSNGRVKGYESNLVPDGAPNFTSGQILPLLPLGHDKAAALVDSGDITPDMSVREIKKAVKAIRDAEKAEDVKEDEPAVQDTEETAPEEDTSIETGESVDLDFVLVHDENGVAYEVPRAVLEVYRIG